MSFMLAYCFSVTVRLRTDPSGGRLFTNRFMCFSSASLPFRIRPYTKVDPSVKTILS